MNKRVLVMGATGGVGTALIEQLHTKYQLLGIYYKNRTKAEELSKWATMITCDIRNSHEVDRAMAEFGEIDVVINAVTPELLLKKFLETTESEFDLFMDVVVKGTANVYRKLLPQMKLKDSVIVNISSVTAINQPVDRMCAYSVAKTAQRRLFEYLNKEMSSSKARMVMITPSFIESEALSVFPQKLLEIQKAQLPGGEFVQPRDLACLIQKIIEDTGKFPHGSDLALANNMDVKKYY